MTDTFMLESDLRAHGAVVTNMRLHGASEDDVAAYLKSCKWDELLTAWKAAR